MNHDPTYNKRDGFKNCNSWRDFILAFNRYLCSLDHKYCITKNNLNPTTS